MSISNQLQLQFVKQETVRTCAVRVYKKINPAQDDHRNHVGVLVIRSTEATQARVFTFFHEDPTLDNSLITRYTLDSFKEDFTGIVMFPSLVGGSLDDICREALGKTTSGYVLVDAQEPEVSSKKQAKLTKVMAEAIRAVERGVEL